jgi:hypothetical protein
MYSLVRKHSSHNLLPDIISCASLHPFPDYVLYFSSLNIIPYILKPGLDNRDYGRSDPPRWPSDTPLSAKLALTSPTSGGRSVGMVRSRTKATESVGRIQKHWDCRVCPPFRIQNKQKSHCFGNWNCIRLQVKRGRYLIWWVQWMRLALSKGANRAGVSHPSLEDVITSSFQNDLFSSF